MKKRLLIVVPLAAAAALGVYLYFTHRFATEPQAIRVSGNIEVTDAEVSFRIAGRVLERLVSEGQPVRSGEILARLDSSELEREVALRKAEVRAAEAALAELLAGSRPEEIAQAAAEAERAKARLDELLAGSRPEEVSVAEAAVESARAEVARWRSESERQGQLFRARVAAARDREVADTAYETAVARLKEAEERLNLVRKGPRAEEIDQARAALRQVQQRLALVTKGPRSETIDQTRAKLEQVREALALAETRLGYAAVVSPLSGLCLSQSIEPGEYVAPGTPVVTVGDLENVWLRGYVSETDLGRVKAGQRVTVTTDTYPAKSYEGRLSFISSQAEFTPKAVQTQKERVKLVYRVKIDIPNQGMELKPGMPADGVIETGGRREGSLQTWTPSALND